MVLQSLSSLAWLAVIALQAFFHFVIGPRFQSHGTSTIEENDEINSTDTATTRTTASTSTEDTKQDETTISRSSSRSEDAGIVNSVRGEMANEEENIIGKNSCCNDDPMITSKYGALVVSPSSSSSSDEDDHSATQASTRPNSMNSLTSIDLHSDSACTATSTPQYLVECHPDEHDTMDDECHHYQRTRSKVIDDHVHTNNDNDDMDHVELQIRKINIDALEVEERTTKRIQNTNNYNRVQDNDHEEMNQLLPSQDENCNPASSDDGHHYDDASRTVPTNNSSTKSISSQSRPLPNLVLYQENNDDCIDEDEEWRYQLIKEYYQTTTPTTLGTSNSYSTINSPSTAASMNTVTPFSMEDDDPVLQPILGTINTLCEKLNQQRILTKLHQDNMLTKQQEQQQQHKEQQQTQRQPERSVSFEKHPVSVIASF